MSVEDENGSIPMDGSAVHYEGDKSEIIPAGTYLFRVVRLRREQVDASQTMPRHVNLKWLMVLEDADGEVGKAWDNLRMYRKWLWKFESVAKAIGHTPKESHDIRIDWNRFEGATGCVEVSVSKWKRRDGTEEPQNNFKYIWPDDGKGQSTQPGRAAQAAAEEEPF